MEPATTSGSLPRYRCHKVVEAFKIAAVQNEPDGSALIWPLEIHFCGPVRVDADYLRKHAPVSGGYYVRYKDGYESFSPAASFEDGYSRLP